MHTSLEFLNLSGGTVIPLCPAEGVSVCAVLAVLFNRQGLVLIPCYMATNTGNHSRARWVLLQLIKRGAKHLVKSDPAIMGLSVLPATLSCTTSPIASAVLTTSPDTF